ncbi:hypothetical protein N7499_001522 [Penicillium canescens]|uniref:Ankyrin repeat protein n=1 Tax=Penicillium canescens TaxID=5083 RepID=A0AAD6N5P5_PENCN|nr:hypothetical protein N7460_008489 [Penicillium canescens]KAJ6097148.1 hypothetical protein N7499_001522 [Penicillium canescens]
MAKEKRDHTWSALLAAYEEGYDRVVKLLLDKRNPFKGMESFGTSRKRQRRTTFYSPTVLRWLEKLEP